MYREGRNEVKIGAKEGEKATSSRRNAAKRNLGEVLMEDSKVSLKI
jgi:hypothetical protein